MPVNIGADYGNRPQGVPNDVAPDIKTDVPLTHFAIISIENPLEWPANFDELPVEEQEKIKAKYRFMGIRLRSDIKDKTIPLTRETLDIP